MKVTVKSLFGSTLLVLFLFSIVEGGLIKKSVGNGLYQTQLMKKTIQPTITSIDARSSSTYLYGALNVTFEYYAAISLGSDSQVFTVQMDTGSNSLAIPSTNCWQYDSTDTAVAQCSHANAYYDQKASKHSKQIKCSDDSQCRCLSDGNCGFSLTYGDGSFLQGELVNDDFTLGGLSTKVTFGEILAESENFAGTNVDGILGLGYQTLDQVDGDSVFEKLVAAGQCDNSFSMCMGQNGGVFTLGGVDETFSGGEMVYTPITKESYYVVEMNDIMIGNESIGVQPSVYNDNYTIVDSGTTFILLNSLAYSYLAELLSSFCPPNMKAICNPNDYISIFYGSCFPVSEENIASFPNISFSFSGGITLSLTPQQYFVRIKSGYCFGIQSTDGVGAILGDVFMQGFNVLFDRENKRMGFAPVANCDNFDLTMSLNDGDNQVSSILWKMKHPLSVQVKYGNGLPAIGALVKFSGEQATFTDDGMSMTDSQGIARMTVRFSKSGKHQVKATLLNFNGEPVVFHLQTTVYALVGIILGSVAGLAIIVLLIVVARRYYKKKQFTNDYQFTTLSTESFDDDEGIDVD